MRRVMFLQNILQEDQNCLISKFFHAQDKKPGKNDWSLTARQNLEELNLNLDFEDIRKMSKFQFHSKASKAMSKLAFEYLLKEKNKGGTEQGKVSHIKFSELKLQEYFKPNNTSVKMAKFIFHARCRMLDLKTNYKNRNYSDMFCPICNNPETTDSQQHLLVCPSLCGSDVVSSENRVEYSDLFSTNIEKQLGVATILERNFAKRSTILKVS